MDPPEAQPRPVVPLAQPRPVIPLAQPRPVVPLAQPRPVVPLTRQAGLPRLVHGQGLRHPPPLYVLREPLGFARDRVAGAEGAQPPFHVP